MYDFINSKFNLIWSIIYPALINIMRARNNRLPYPVRTDLNSSIISEKLSSRFAIYKTTHNIWSEWGWPPRESRPGAIAPSSPPHLIRACLRGIKLKKYWSYNHEFHESSCSDEMLNLSLKWEITLLAWIQKSFTFTYRIYIHLHTGSTLTYYHCTCYRTHNVIRFPFDGNKN